MGIMWYMFNMFKGGQQTSRAGVVMITPLYQRGDLVDVRVMLSEIPYYRSLTDGNVVWFQENIGVGTTPQHNFTYMYEPSQHVKNNGSVYLHAIFSKPGVDPEARDELAPGDIFTKTVGLIRYLPRPKNKTGVNLLTSDSAPVRTPTAPPEAPSELISFWKPNMTISLVDHFQAYNRDQVPQQIRSLFQFSDDSSDHYLPLVHFDEFWLLRDKLMPMNETVDSVPLHLVINTASFWWMQLQQQMDQSFSMQVNIGIANDGESDEVKRIFLEGNPILLGVTMAVSMLHSVFDFLAFKNDVTFWKDNRSMEGLSARSILVNAFCQLIILFYLLDNETSTVVLISSAVGTAIEFWKVTKAFDVSVMNSFPFISIKDKASYKDTRHNTNKYDADAMRYLSYALYPCVIGYSIYALVYDTHKSWHSWILSSLVGAVYTFGFILMCPQLYLNYKLKSVAHLPWRQMTYKFLNTIIDDLFAFVIKMPLLHRLSVFRDDVIFLIFLYQRWIYRVDKSRVNEFGFSAEMQEEREKAAIAAGTGTAGELPAPPAESEAGAAGEEQAAPGAARQRKQSKRAQAAAEAAAGTSGDGEGPEPEENRKDQ